MGQLYLPRRQKPFIPTCRQGSSYPEVNIEVACAAELAISHLESDCHPVILVKALVEALHAVRRQNNVVSGGDLEGHRSDEERPRC